MTNRESLRDTVNCLSAHQKKFYHLGINFKVNLSTLALEIVRKVKSVFSISWINWKMFVRWINLLIMSNQIYSTCLTDEQWNFIKEYFPKTNNFGRPREIEYRSFVNAILYLLQSGIQWRLMPKDFPKWKTVHHYFTVWRKNG